MNEFILSSIAVLAALDLGMFGGAVMAEAVEDVSRLLGDLFRG